jgi:glycosyltransferase involved in cell wall biosynthesis
VLPHKGYDDLVRALALLQEKLPRVKCLIVGKAPRRGYLRKLLRRAEHLSIRERLIVAGFQEDVVPFLHAMDVFVLPSRTEGLPITILEAMAAGKPVVATAVGGIPEVVRDDETGLLVPPGDPGRLAEAVMRLLEAPALAKAMGEAGRRQVESRFTMEQEARQTARVYGQVLTAYSSGSLRNQQPRAR